MGAHNGNHLAKLAAQANSSPGNLIALASAVEIAGYAYAYEVSIEPNAAKKAEIQAFLDAELAAGKKPGEIDVKFELKPEDQDYVVYHRIQQLRSLKVVDKTMAVNIRGPEHFRMPLAEVNARAQQAFDGGPSDIKG